MDADVVIVGGGPAGSTLGCLLAAAKHKAILIERAGHPREHVGELLTPSVNAVLHRIGLLSRIDDTGFVRREGVVWTTADGPGKATWNIPVADYPPPRALLKYGFNVERDVFDAMLLGNARDLGAQVFERTAVRQVLFENDRAIGVEIQLPCGEIRSLRSRFTVDATGRRSLLGRQLHLIDRDTSRCQCSFYAWFRAVTPTEPVSKGFAHLHLLGNRRAWGWQIPLRDDVTSVGIVAPCGEFQTDTDRSAVFTHLIEDNRIFQCAMENAERMSPWRTVGDYSYRARRMYGAGWLLVGDASGFIDPIFSSGVDIAMYSAVFAYEAMLPLLLLGRWSKADEEFALSKYEDRVRSGMAVWAKAVELFYNSPKRLRRLVGEPSALPSVCRFLQGNPYEVQNEMIAQQLFKFAHR
jgi:FADH2 O2-dependent halogenase